MLQPNDKSVNGQINKKFGEGGRENRNFSSNMAFSNAKKIEIKKKPLPPKS